MNSEVCTPQPQAKRILVVEDENIVSQDIQHRVKALGFLVAGSSVTGEDAVTQALATRPDLILMDIRLKGEMDGIEAARLIRQEIDIPIIYLTAYSDAATLDRAKNTGPFGYILKPLEERDLKTTVEMALYRHAIDWKLAGSERSLREAQRLGKIGSWEFDVLTGRMSWSEELFRLFERDPKAGPPDLTSEHSRYYPDTVTLSKAVGTFMKSGEQVTLEHQVRLPDGRTAWHSGVINPEIDSSGRIVKLVGIVQDITERKQHEEKIVRLNRLYGMLSHTNKAIVKTASREELFAEVCRVAVTCGGFRMAWVGLLDTGTKQVVPVAAAGEGVDYLKEIKVTVLDEPSGRGPIGISIRAGGHYVCNDFLADPRILPWRSEAEKWGFASLAAFSLKVNDATIGALALYSGEQGFFNEELIALLLEVADDISYALTNLDLEARRRKAEALLRTLSTVVEQSPVCIFISDPEGNLTYVNPAFSTLTGYDSADVLGRNPRLLQSGLTPPETYQELWETITAGKTWQGEFLNKKKNGELYWEWAVIAPVTDEQGGIGPEYVSVSVLVLF